MNPSTALATVLVDELVRGGVTEVVLAPGSRSAPLALALHAADTDGRLRLHVRIDERGAGFLALGLAKASGRTVPVVTTSGTAVANLHPAVLEAHHTGTRLLVLSADRPPELRRSGANQTIDQPGLYGAAAVGVELGVPERLVGQVAYWRATVCRVLAVPGPVQLNLALRAPLVPDGTDDWPEPLDGRADGGPWTTRVPAEPAPTPVDDLPARTLVVLADGGDARAATRLARARGWPVVAEPTVTLPADADDVLVACGEALLAGGFAQRHRPDRVLVVGRPTLSRAVQALVAQGPTDVVAHLGGWADPQHAAQRVLPVVPAPGGGDPEQGWQELWRAAGDTASAAVDRVLDDVRGTAEAGVARVLSAVLPADGLLVVGSSKPVRDLALVGVRPGTAVVANRGVAGIDGMVSTAVGAALAHQAAGGGQAFALLGDLTFLHDSTALVIGPREPRPDLTVVVVNNDGGAIFGTLEQGGAEHAGAFERVFGTPHGTDLAALCAATGTPYERADTSEGLVGALARRGGIRVVEVQASREVAVRTDREVRAAVAAATGG